MSDEHHGMNPALKVILGVVAGLCLLACAGIALGGWLLKKGVDTIEGTAQVARTRATLEQIESAITAFRVETRALPESLDDVAAREGLLPDGRVPVDAWGRAIRYQPGKDGRSFTLISLGADGAEGGTGADADVIVVH